MRNTIERKIVKFWSSLLRTLSLVSMNICTQVLVGIPLETGQKQYTVDYKLETYLKIARLYLEDEDPVQGEAYINRAAQLQTQTKDDHLQIIYKVLTNTKGLYSETTFTVMDRSSFMKRQHETISTHTLHCIRVNRYS